MKDAAHKTLNRLATTVRSVKGLLRIRDDLDVQVPEDFVDWYSENVRSGACYYELPNWKGGQPLKTGDPDALGISDLGWVVLLAGQPRHQAARSLYEKTPFTIAPIPAIDLHQTTDAEREEIASWISEISGWRGFASSTATKLLHKKRPRSVPILDNQAIYGSFLRADWTPGGRLGGNSYCAMPVIKAALDSIYKVVADGSNEEIWRALENQYGSTRVELFDMVWWTITRNPDSMTTSIVDGRRVCSLTS